MGALLVYHKETVTNSCVRRHIIQDLMPYICILESCPAPESLFESGKDWLNHMRNQHSVSGWACVDSTHDTTLFFHTQYDFINHLTQDHEDQLDDDDICDLVAACYQRLPDDVMIKECPFCPKTEDADSNASDMMNHIAGHLLSLAQISLTGHIDDGESESAWSKSERGPSLQVDSTCSFAQHQEADFSDSDVSESSETQLYSSDAGVPDADAERVHALWNIIQPPKEELLLDKPLRHLMAVQETRGATDIIQ